MSDEKITLKNFIETSPLLEKKKKKKAKKKKKRRGGGLADSWFTQGSGGNGSGMSTGGDGGGGGGGESVTFKPLSNRETLIMELLAGVTPSAFSANINSATGYSKNSNKQDAGMTTYPSADDDWGEEEVEKNMGGTNKVDKARQLFQSMYNQKNMTRTAIIDAFMKDVDLSNSSAVSYYTRFLKEFGINSDADDEVPLGQGSGMGGDLEQANPGDGDLNTEELPDETLDDSEIDTSDRAGIIRTVDNAHLVYKRQDQSGTFTELWIYNLHDTVNTELEIRRDILAGTDIPVKKTKSPDGQQSYVITTMGNAQMLLIKGLSN